MKKKFIETSSLIILIFKGILSGIFSFFTSFLLDRLINNGKNKN